MKLGSKDNLLDTPCKLKYKTDLMIYKVLKRSNEPSRKNWYYKVCSVNHH